MTKNDIDGIGSAFLTTEEVMAILRVNIRTIYRLIRAREIPAVRVGRQWRFRRSDLEVWLAAGIGPSHRAGAQRGAATGMQAASFSRPPCVPRRGRFSTQE